MPTYSTNSMSKLYTCDERIITIFEEVIKFWDNKVLYGFRGEAEQNALYDAGKSKVRFPNGKHNSYPSKAIDVAPYGVWGPGRPEIVWPVPGTETFSKDLAAWYYFSGFVLGIATAKGIKLRHGADWNGNRQINDQTFDDLAHFESVEE
jgi:peptidoglycan L-alanyl-D-glutamate endopeptidase CwlK